MKSLYQNTQKNCKLYLRSQVTAVKIPFSTFSSNIYLQFSCKLKEQNFQVSPSWENRINQQRTLMPRLVFSNDLLQNVILGLEKEKSHLSKRNETLSNHTSFTAQEIESIEREKFLCLTLIVLRQIQNGLKTLNHVGMIPQKIPSYIPTIRGLSSKLNAFYPDYSFQLCELSSVLGSILMDSASIIEAKFDFRQSNLDSSLLLDEAKLIADSKLDKLYPNLDSFRAKIT